MANILLGDFAADVNLTFNRFSPLMMAAVKDCPDIIELLAYFKADVRKVNKKGFSAVDYAVLYGSLKSLQTLDSLYDLGYEV